MVRGVVAMSTMSTTKARQVVSEHLDHGKEITDLHRFAKALETYRRWLTRYYRYYINSGASRGGV